MKKILIVIAAASTSIWSARLGAQSAGAIAGWTALVSTPVGGLTPMNNVLGLPERSTPAARSRPAVQFRYGHWGMDPDLSEDNLGLALTTKHNTVATTWELGYTRGRSCDGCDGLDGLLAGIDVQMPLGSSPQGRSMLEVGLNPAFGFMVDGNSNLALSGGLSLPVALSIPISPFARFIPFLSPGVGAGYVRSDGDGESGSRVMLGGGFTLDGTTWPVRVTASLRKVFLDGAPTVFGFGLSVTP